MGLFSSSKTNVTNTSTTTTNVDVNPVISVDTAGIGAAQAQSTDALIAAAQAALNQAGAKVSLFSRTLLAVGGMVGGAYLIKKMRSG